MLSEILPFSFFLYQEKKQEHNGEKKNKKKKAPISKSCFFPSELPKSLWVEKLNFAYV